MIAFLLQASLLAQNLDAILEDPKLDGAVVGAIVLDGEGKTVYEKNADLQLVPASNQKLISAAFALEKLGYDYRFSTRFWRVNDQIVVDAPGDPTLTLGDLVRARRALGVSAKRIAVRQAFRVPVPPGWEYDDLKNRYAPSICAISFDRSGFELWASNRKLEKLPPWLGVRVKRESGQGRVSLNYDRLTGLLRVRGALPKARTLLDTYAMPWPDVAAARLLGGAIEHVGTVPVRPPDYEIVSPPLSLIVRDGLERSDNRIAEHLLLAAGTGQESDLLEPYGAAISALQAWLAQRYGPVASSLVPADGSGLSRYNLVTARGLATLLFSSEARFRALLPKPGLGTLKNRLSTVPFIGKTGTMKRISALSGFVTGADGRTYVVSLLFNNYRCSAQAARVVQDQFIGRLAGPGLLSTDLSKAEDSLFHSGKVAYPQARPAQRESFTLTRRPPPGRPEVRTTAVLR